ncbi:hypothetical protein LIER_39047 [Lithospermum erythrorhizon]|uniref:Uncharacterized protein n=1 Tax=Lithospermum erythrorhizon TaxID=34254 RepID=A0AAV3QA70_LITER
MITIGSLWGHSTPSNSFREKDRSGNWGCAPTVTTYISRFTYARLALLESPPPHLPPEITFSLPMILGGPSGDLDPFLSKRLFTLWVSLWTYYFRCPLVDELLNLNLYVSAIIRVMSMIFVILLELSHMPLILRVFCRGGRATSACPLFPRIHSRLRCSGGLSTQLSPSSAFSDSWTC